ncbi:MAG: MFS transporter [Dongiaceae bacterium]
MSAVRFEGIRVFRHRDFSLMWGSTFLASVAMQMQAVAIGWQMYDLTGRALDLGLVGLAEFLPSVLLVFFTGAAADRFDRRIVTILAIGGEALCAGALFYMAWTGTADRLSILAAAAGFGVARAFVNPAVRALIPTLVPVRELANAIVWSSISWQIAIVDGPAIGGFLYAVGGADAAYAGASLMLVAAALAMAFMGRPMRASQEGRGTTISEIVAGMKLILERRILLGGISLDLFAVLFSGAVALLPIFAKDILQVGPDGLGLLRAAPGVGAVVMALVLAQYPLRHSVGKILFLAIGIFGLAAIAFGFSKIFWLSLVLLMVMGAGDMVSVYIRGTIVPLATPDRLRGRVMAVEMVFVGASNELGLFSAGVLASIFGAVGAVAFGGTATVLTVLIWMRLFPELLRIERLDLASLGFRDEEPPDKLDPAASREGG